MTAPRFQVSNYCGAGACVAVAALDNGQVAVRDEKVQDGPLLIFTANEWDAFVAGVKDGQFDRASLAAAREDDLGVKL